MLSIPRASLSRKRCLSLMLYDELLGAFPALRRHLVVKQKHWSLAKVKKIKGGQLFPWRRKSSISFQLYKDSTTSKWIFLLSREITIVNLGAIREDPAGCTYVIINNMKIPCYLYSQIKQYLDALAALCLCSLSWMSLLQIFHLAPTWWVQNHHQQRPNVSTNSTFSIGAEARASFH